MLREELSNFNGRRRTFLLLRIADIDVNTARSICQVPKGTYNNWLNETKFSSINRRVKELSGEYKQEAIHLLRRTNQLEAVLLEGKIISKLKDELNMNEYVLAKTPIAKEVYSKLINDLDYQPQTANLTWEQRIDQLNVVEKKEALPQGGIIEGIICEETSEQEDEFGEEV